MGTKRKLSGDYGVETPCCRKLSLFACTCAIVSLLVQTFSFVGKEDFKRDLDVKATNLMKNVLDDTIEAKIEAYLTQLTESGTRRIRREAMLVRIEINF